MRASRRASKHVRVRARARAHTFHDAEARNSYSHTSGNKHSDARLHTHSKLKKANAQTTETQALNGKLAQACKKRGRTERQNFTEQRGAGTQRETRMQNADD